MDNQTGMQFSCQRSQGIKTVAGIEHGNIKPNKKK